ncbi:P-loop containing nucleoside triphosphate hydrolase protein, partial [Mytilinidion resinicola]
ILTDAEAYFDKETRAWYFENGTPYRRGYLLYGPPGTGKTSLSLALAGRFDLGLYAINANEAGLDDAKLIDRFNQLPDRCVVLLEDIDAAGIIMDRHNAPPPVLGSRNSKLQQTSPGVSLSGLLNGIDGPTWREGRLLIMTTNAPRSLDPALYRAGRVDKKIYLGYSTKRTGAITFRRIFAKDPRNKYSMERIIEFSRQFGAKVPLDTFTPAELQNCCMEHRGKPQGAISAFDTYISRRLNGEDRFEYDIGDCGRNGGDEGLSEDEALEDLRTLDFAYLTKEGIAKF